jgi:hypothetical protein
MKPDKITTFRRRMTLAALAIVIVAGIYFFFAYGSWKVLAGMDTMIPEYPPGATCIIEKNPSRVQAKTSVIILEVSGGAALLSRVDRVHGEKIYIKHDNRQSEFLHFEERAYTIADVRGLVLTVLIPEAPHGK